MIESESENTWQFTAKCRENSLTKETGAFVLGLRSVIFGRPASHDKLRNRTAGSKRGTTESIRPESTRRGEKNGARNTVCRRDFCRGRRPCNSRRVDDR